MSSELNERGQRFYESLGVDPDAPPSPHPYAKYLRPIAFTYELSNEEWFGPPSPTKFNAVAHAACWNGEVYCSWPMLVNQECAVCGEWIHQGDASAGRIVWIPPAAIAAWRAQNEHR